MRVALCLLGVLGGGPAQLGAQPDPRQMAGIPRPVDDLPNGSVSVRVIRGGFTNNIPNQLVELRVGSDVMRVKTDAEGRAQFDKLPAGQTVKAVADVDGEHLESQPFPAPAQGGIRLVLLAGAGGDASAGPPAAPGPPAAAGDVVIGGQTRFVLQPAEESVEIYYLLELLNNSAAPVNPRTPLVFEMPQGVREVGLMQGSSPLASAEGPRVSVSGPLPPGATSVYIAAQADVTSGSYNLVQPFPVPLDNYAFIVKKVGDTKVSSPQLSAQQDIPAQGDIFIGAQGTPLAAGQALTVSLSDMPHHSPAPLWTALALALGIVIIGVWAAARPSPDAGSNTTERAQLIARREKLLADLVRLERERRNSGRGAGDDDGARYGPRREELVAALENVYGALDSDDAGPGPGAAAGAVA